MPGGALDQRERFLGAGAIGDFRLGLMYTYVDEYLQQILPTDPFRRLQQTFDVESRASLNINWSRGDFGATVNGNYIDSTEYSDMSARLSSLTTWDVQFSWATPWNGRVAVGARNVTNEDPPTDFLGLDNPFYSNQLHDVFGRVPYLRYEQDL